MSKVALSDCRGPLADLLDKLSGEQGSDWLENLKRMLRKDSAPVRTRRDEDGIIYFSVTSDGTTGEGWITRLEAKGFRVGNYAKQLLRSYDFQPTKGVTTEVAVLKGSRWHDDDRITKKIRAEAFKMKFASINAEMACLIREYFTDQALKELGLNWINIMHDPIKVNGETYRLVVHRNDGGGWLDAHDGIAYDGWSRSDGFAFAVPQVSP